MARFFQAAIIDLKIHKIKLNLHTFFLVWLKVIDIRRWLFQENQYTFLLKWRKVLCHSDICNLLGSDTSSLRYRPRFDKAAFSRCFIITFVEAKDV